MEHSLRGFGVLIEVTCNLATPLACAREFFGKMSPGHFLFPKNWWSLAGSNRRPTAVHAGAPPDDVRPHRRSAHHTASKWIRPCPASSHRPNMEHSLRGFGVLIEVTCNLATPLACAREFFGKMSPGHFLFPKNWWSLAGSNR